MMVESKFLDVNLLMTALQDRTYELRQSWTKHEHRILLTLSSTGLLTRRRVAAQNL